MTIARRIIPVLDVSDGGPLRHAVESADRARRLGDECLATFPRALQPLIPALDGVARRWLSRSSSPYAAEIAQIAAILGIPGVFLLNSTYLWSCTAVAKEEEGVPWLARTLDWPFPGLGRHVNVVRARAAAGEYFSVTWPGYAGVLTAMAPGRFAASINQAPMYRRTRHNWLRIYDLAANGLNTFANIRHMPPDQLLRQAFETCASYSAAKEMLESTPVARPVIYMLAGIMPGERCVIERTETGFQTRGDKTSSANDWVPARPNWEARMSAEHFLRLSYEEAAARNRERHEALGGWEGLLSQDGFAWVRPPVLNPYTRVAITMSPALGILRAAGYEALDSGLPQPVTGVCEVRALPA